MRLDGKVALITGGGTGIGAAIAQRFAASGAKVSVTGRRSTPIKDVADKINGIAIQGDTSDSNDCEAAVSQTVTRYGGLNILVANAGIVGEGSVISQDEKQWNEVIDINVSGVMRIARAAIPAIINSGGGSITIISSVAGLTAAGELASYITSKSAVIGLTKSMACDFASDGIRVNAICPGWVKTPMAEEDMKHIARQHNISVEEAIRNCTRFNPIKRMAEPDEIAACAEFLSSDDASYITGVVIPVDGGGEIVNTGLLS